MNKSAIFMKSTEITWDSVGEGLQRQILCYDSQLMMTRVLFEKDAIGAQHQHPHRQVTYVEAGTFEVYIAEMKQILHAGDSFFVPPNTNHGVVALAQGALIDVFTPFREDFVVPTNG